VTNKKTIYIIIISTNKEYKLIMNADAKYYANIVNNGKSILTKY